VGVSLDNSFAANADDCLNKCITFEGKDLTGDGEFDTPCAWFTYDSLTQNCELLDSCQRLSNGCSTCVSGSVHCGSPYSGKLYA